MIAEVLEIDGNKVAVPISGAIPTGLPVGTWISFEKDQAPDNKWIKAGETFDENLYPALYLFLGTNKVPERFDHSRLSDIETITLSTTNTEMQYDGELLVSFLKSANLQGYSILVNDVSFTLIDSGNAQVGTTITIPFKKGDKIRLNVSYSPNNTSVRYYKHPMFIKATSAIEITDQSTFLNTVQSLVQTSNSYSTEEIATGGTWFDGKPIYKKVVTYNSEFGVSQSGTDFTRTALEGEDVDNYVSITAFNSTGARNVKRFTPCGFAWNNDTSIKIFSCSQVGNHFLGFTLEYTKN